MSSKPILLRIRCRDGVHRIDCLTNDSTVRELKAVLMSLTGETVDKILFGYPSVSMSLDNDMITLEDAQIRSGDVLTVQTSQSSPKDDNNSMQRHSQQQQSSNMPNASFRDELNNPSYGENSGRPKTPGILMRRVVPANNSCLFTSVYFGISGGIFDMREGSGLRQIIANAVASDPVTYCEAFLGKPNREYCTWILNEDHWGGGIELAILSKHYKTEIVAVDTQNVRLNRFGEDENYSKRILLIYDGIHYDPLLLESLSDSSTRTSFDIEDDEILRLALELAHEARSSRQFTDVQNFTLRCLVCNQGVVGQNGAKEHARLTDHQNFGEY